MGVIWKNTYSEPKNIKIKDINKKMNYSIDKKLINFIEWFSVYNMVPIGLVLKRWLLAIMIILLKKRSKFFNSKNLNSKKYILNKEQSNALKFLEIDDDKFNVSVLQGTTGSGKTLVYFERIKKGNQKE